jgi:nifR3 family TIM-barrel protein
MGCPVRKVTKTGAGSALMLDPGRAARIVEAIATRTGVPVTAKIRAGWDAHSVNAVEVARALAGGGCAAVAVHPRTRAQGYSGQADWSVIAGVAAAVPIPVIGNGDVWSASDAHRMVRQTGCAAVMIGRAAMGNPWIFAQLARGEAPPSRRERWPVIARHLAAHVHFVGDELKAVRSFRKQLMWYAHGVQGATAFRREVARVDDVTELRERCERFFS